MPEGQEILYNSIIYIKLYDVLSTKREKGYVVVFVKKKLKNKHKIRKTESDSTFFC